MLMYDQCLLCSNINVSEMCRGAGGGAQWTKCPTPDPCSSCDPVVYEIEPLIGLQAEDVEPTWDSLPPSLSALPPLARAHVLSLFLKINIK